MIIDKAVLKGGAAASIATAADVPQPLPAATGDLTCGAVATAIEDAQ